MSYEEKNRLHPMARTKSVVSSSKYDNLSINYQQDKDKASTTSPSIMDRSSYGAPQMRRSETEASKMKSKIFKFTQKATKIAADVAFGSASIDKEEDIKLTEYRHKMRAKAEESKKTLEMKKFETLFKSIRDHSMEFYLDYLRFFLKYMDDSEWDDVLNYANMRNDLWRGWQKKLFIKLDDIMNHWENENSSSSSSTTMLRTLNMENLRDISIIDKELFHDRQITLLMLWSTQIMKRVINQPLILKQLTSTMKSDCEICILTKNKLKPIKPNPNEYLPQILQTHISPANLEFIDGWQMRHDFQSFKINFITLSDRYQALLDKRKAGYLSDDLHQQYPHFNDADFLSDKFINNFMDEKERNFLLGYSSFSVPTISRIPLNTGLHGLIYSPDFSRLIKNELEMQNSLREFQRLLKPDGKIYLQFLDLTPIPKAENRVGIGLNIKDIVEVDKFEYVRLLIDTQIAEYAGSFKANMSNYVLQYLKTNKDWKNVKFCKVGLPVIEGKDYGCGLEISSNGNEEEEEEEDIKEETQNGIEIKNQNGNVKQQKLKGIGMGMGIGTGLGIGTGMGMGMGMGIIDSRTAAMFDMNASFLDFLKVTSVLGLLDWHKEKVKPNPEVIKLARLWIDWKRFGLEGEFIKDLMKSRTLVNGVDLQLGVRVCFEGDNNGEDKGGGNVRRHKSPRTVSGLGYTTAIIAQRV